MAASGDKQVEIDRRVGAAIRAILRETSSSVSLERKLGANPSYQVTAYGREWRGPFDVWASVVEGLEAQAVSATAYYEEHAPVVLEQKDIPSIQDVQRSWAEAHDAAFDPNSANWRDRIRRDPQPGGGNLYTLDGRDYTNCSRCEGCGVYGRLTDTELCPDCEEQVPKMAARVAARELAAAA